MPAEKERIVVLRARVVGDFRKNGQERDSHHFFREEFQISQESEDFFPEEGPALERLSRSFSRDLVSTILESF